jgi:hypothetical protein
LTILKTPNKNTKMLVEEKFSLEIELRNLIAKNKQLVSEIILEPDLVGMEYPAGKWFIDLLYQDADKNYVIVELKRDSTSDRTIGQIGRYITWVRENLAGEGVNVRGVIICGADDEKLAYAARAVQDVTIAVYSIDLLLSIVPNIPGYQGDSKKEKPGLVITKKPKNIKPNYFSNNRINQLGHDEAIKFSLENSRRGSFILKFGKRDKQVIEHRVKDKSGAVVIKVYKRHRIVSIKGVLNKRVADAIRKQNKASEENNSKWLAYWESRLIEFN